MIIEENQAGESLCVARDVGLQRAQTFETVCLQLQEDRWSVGYRRDFKL